MYIQYIFITIIKEKKTDPECLGLFNFLCCCLHWPHEYLLLCDTHVRSLEADDLCLQRREGGDSAVFINTDPC